MTIRCRSLLCFLPLLIVVFLLSQASPGRAQALQIQAQASPARVAYDTDHTVIVTVLVRDASGRPVEDGTGVFFNTTLGALPTVAYTQAGKVSVVMENTTGPGMAIVTVTVNNSRQTLQVEYLGQGGKSVAAPPKRIFYRLSAKQIYYSVEKKIFDMKDQARFESPMGVITADAMQLSLDQNLLLAQQNVTITANKKTVAVHSLRLLLSANAGAAITVSPDIAYQSFTLPSLVLKEDEAAHVDFSPLDPLPTHTWILTQRVLIFPQEQIQFTHPRFYLDTFDKCLYSLPYHVINLRTSSDTSLFNSNISVTSDAGLNIDFPVYYAADADHVGSLHLREVARGASDYTGAAGMEVGIEEDYRVGDTGNGGLFLDDLSRDTRSVTWEHTNDFGPTHLTMNAGYQRYTVDTPYTTSAGFGVSRPLGPCTANLTGNWSSFDQNQDGVSEFSLGLPSLALGRTGLGLGFTPYLGLHHNYSVTTVQITGPKTSGSSLQVDNLDDNFYQGLRTGLTVPVWKVLGGSVNTTVSNDLVRDGDNNVVTDYFDTGVSLSRRLSHIFTSSLGYSLGASRSSDSTLNTKATNRLSMNLNGSGGQNWNMSFYSNYSMDDHSFYGSGGMTYYLPWWRAPKEPPRVFLQYQGSMTTGAFQTVDHMLTLGWRISQFSLLMHYSPSGNNAVTGLGTGTGKKWAIELVRQGW